MDLTRFYNQFREETTENIRLLGDGLLALEQVRSMTEPGAREHVDAIFRAMHTVKGSSRLLGFGAVGRLAHTMENILGAVREGTHTLNRALIDDMLRSGDALLEMTVAAVEGGSTNINVDELIEKLTSSLEASVVSSKAAPAAEVKPPDKAKPAEQEPDADYAEDATLSSTTKTRGELTEEELEVRRKARAERRKARASEMRAKPDAGDAAPDAGEEKEPTQPQDEAKKEAPPAKPAPAPTTPTPTQPLDASAPITPSPIAPPAQRPVKRQQTVRVRVDRLDKLINYTGELVVGQQMLADHVQVLHTMTDLIHQQERELQAFRTLLHEMRIPKDQHYNANMHLNNLLNYHDQLRQLLRGPIEQYGSNVDRQGMLIGDLEQEVMAARMLPISNVFSTLPRAVRELAHTTNKEVELIMRGETTELDRKLLEALQDPLLHIIRNGIDHGIELPEDREAEGKPRQGHITVSAEATGGQVQINVSDDGRGMQPQKLRDIAVRKNLITRENAALLSDQEALELIFLPGFSSAAFITDISGRGVGMDVVRTNITELGGQVTIESTPSQGTTISLVLPMTIVTTRILLINVGSHTLAFPATGCQGIIWVKQNQIRTIEGRATIAYEEQTVPLMRMADLMNVEAPQPFENGKREPALLFGTSHRLISVLVDRLVDEREAVVKPLGPILELQRRYSGAVQLGNGQLVLLLNPVALVQAARGIALSTAAVSTTPAMRQRPRLLIAEDSFTTRELLRSILQSAGFDVTPAVDGVDAFSKIQTEPFDLIVTDVEMPRMDGFTLCSNIRQELDSDVPVVIITSLATDEYRQRGLEAGAQAYVVKSQFNQDNLLNVIHQLLGT